MQINSSLLILLMIPFVALLFIGGVVDFVRRRTRTKTIRYRTWPLVWLPLIERSLPIYRRMPMDLRENLQEVAWNLSLDKLFDGLGELEEFPDKIKVSALLHAALPQLNLRIPPNPLIRVIVVGTEAELDEARDRNPQWSDSFLLCLWDEASRTCRPLREERNELTMAAWRKFRPSTMKGPERDHLYFAAWASALYNDRPEQLEAMASRMPELAADRAAFTGASEAFFRSPDDMATEHPAEYAALVLFYLMDPARWGRRQ